METIILRKWLEAGYIESNIRYPTLKGTPQGGIIEEIRVIEGITARKMYHWLNIFIDDERFHIKKRIRKRPDNINSLLNSGYYLLFSRLNATVRTVGLNPYLGFFHIPEDSHESLVSDFVELFRSRIDRFVLRMLNLRVIGFDDFTLTIEGMYLDRGGQQKGMRNNLKPSLNGLPVKMSFH